MTTTQQNDAPLRLHTLTAYGLPSLPTTILTFPLFVLLPTFYAQDLGLGFAVVGAVLLGTRLWDAISDPLVGALSDRLNTPFGRRRPWIIVGAPLAMVSAWFLLVPGPDVDWIYLLIWTIALYTSGTMVLIPYNAWGAEISTDYHERARITSARQVFVLIGGLTAVGLLGALQSDRATLLMVTALIVIIGLPLCVGAATTMVRDHPRSQERPLTFGRAVAVIRTNGPFKRLLSAFFLNNMANGFPITLFLLFAEHRLRAGPEMIGLILAAYFAVALLSVPFWLAMTKRFGKHRVWVAAMFMVCAFFMWVPLLGQGDAWWLFAISVFTGFGLGADLVLPPAMQADVIDLDELRHREKRTGVFFAIWSLAQKLSLALAVGIAFPILGWVGFQQTAEENGPTALLVLAILYAIAPIVFKCGAMALIWGFPLNSKKQAQIRRLIEKKHGGEGLKSAPAPAGA